MSRRSEVAQVSRRGYWREAEARVMVEAWRSGGETLTEFAARYGVDPKRIARWASRLQRPRPEAVRFHPVRLVGVEPGKGSGSAIEIRLVGGRGGRGFTGVGGEGPAAGLSRPPPGAEGVRFPP